MDKYTKKHIKNLKFTCYTQYLISSLVGANEARYNETHISRGATSLPGIISLI